MTLHDRKEAARRLNISLRGLCNLLSSGALQAVKLGGRTLIRDEELDRFVASLPVAVFNAKPDQADAAAPGAGT